MTTSPALQPIPLSHNRSFNLLWLGEGVSVLGNATSSVLLPLLAVVGFDAGPGWMGILSAAAWLPWLVVGLPAGAWVDRLPARRVMIAADLVSAAAYASVPAAWAMDVLSLTHLAVVALIGGVATVFFRTAYAVLLPHVVPASQLEEANGRLFGTESAMQIAGPGAGGLLAQVIGAALGTLLDALSFLVSALCLWRIKPASAPPSPAAHDVEKLAVQIREGVRFVARDRYLPWLTVIGGIANFGLTGYGALLVLYFVRDLELNPSAVGAAIAIGGCGALLGAVLAARISRVLGSGRASSLLLICQGPPGLLIAFAPAGWGVAVAVAGYFGVGYCVAAGNVIRGAWRMRYVPARLMGRVITAMQVVNYGTMPLAGISAGVLGATIGVRPTIAVMASLVVLGNLLILLSPFRGLRDLPPPRSEQNC